MVNTTTTSPLRQTPVSSHRPRPLNWRERGVGIARIVFGLVWVVAAVLQWLPHTVLAHAPCQAPGKHATTFKRNTCSEPGYAYKEVDSGYYAPRKCITAYDRCKESKHW